MAQRSTPPDISISSDNLKAYLMLFPIPDEEPDYSVVEIKELLKEKKVVYGIDESVISLMVSEKRYMEKTCIAKGQPSEPGIDGYYIYNFNKNPSRKPTVREDGTVDYRSINLIETVVKGQAIVQYNPAVQGKTGYTVFGTEIQPPRAKEQPPLKGRGFERTPDNSTYIAAVDGKIEMQKDHIVINPVYEVFGNADMKTGNIDFPGAVVVHGNVCSGIVIKASESVTVDGAIEAAQIESGKDVIIRNGIKGGYQAKITAKGNVFAKYIEYATIKAGEDISADMIIGSEVHCGRRILMTGRRGRIVGGKMIAVSGVEAKEIGNEAEPRTIVRVGAQVDVLQQIEVLKRKISDTQEKLERIEFGIKEFDRLVETRDDFSKSDPRRMQLLKMQIRDKALLAADKAELAGLQEIVSNAMGAKVQVLSKVYAGAEIGIDNVHVNIRDYHEHVEFIKRNDRIVMNSLVAAAR